MLLYKFFSWKDPLKIDYTIDNLVQLLDTFQTKTTLNKLALDLWGYNIWIKLKII